MRKLLIIASLLFATVASTAEAQNYNNRNGYQRGGQGYNRGYNRNVYVNNNYYGRRGGWNNNGAAWAAGLGGLAAGAILGGVIANQYAAPQPVYPASPIYPGCTQTSFYNQYGQRVVQTTCP